MSNTVFKHKEKYEYELRTSDSYEEVKSYIYMKDGFNIKDTEIFFSIENKKKYEALKNNFECHTFRIKYNHYSRFFNLDDLAEERSNSLLDYNISRIDKKENVAYQKIPLDTEISSGVNIKKLENYTLKITFNDMVNNTFSLPQYPIIELEKPNGNIIHYIKETNTLLFNGPKGYLTIRDVISKGLLVYQDVYPVTINGIDKYLKDVLIYNNTIVGKLECTNKYYLDDTEAVTAKIMDSDFDIGLGVFAVLEKEEDVLYYSDADKIIGNLTYNEYLNGDIIFSKETNKLKMVTKEGMINLDINNIIYSYDAPDTDNLGTLWFDIAMSSLRIFDGSSWKLMSKPSLQTLCKKIELDRKFGVGGDNYLEVYGFNDPEEFKTVEMVISSPLIYDVGFAIGDQFVDSVFINGTEIDSYTDSTEGVHLDKPLIRGDLFQAITTKKKNFEWVDGHVLNYKYIMLSYPFVITHVKKLLINNIEYKINKIDQNRIPVKELVEVNQGDIILNPCDKVRAKVKTSTVISSAYPDFKVEYAENRDEVELPFEMKQNRFDNLIVTNNGKEVIVNPQVILQEEDLFAYYSALEPTKLKFSRKILPEDSILVQFIKHTDCEFGKESLFENSLTFKDLSDKLILDSVMTFEDPTLTLNYTLQKIDDIINKTPSQDSGGNSSGNNDNTNNGIDIDNTVGQIIIGGMNVDTKTEDEKLQELIDSICKPSNPDISENFLNNRPMPAPIPNKYRPIYARPSNTYMKPTINVIIKNSSSYRKYNLEFTNMYMASRNQLKEYLYGLNSQLSQVISDLVATRDALRNMIHYLCNTLCLEEILKTLVAGFSSLVSGISQLGSLFKGDALGKLKGLMSGLKDKLANTLKDLGASIKDLIGLARDAALAAWGSVKALVMNTVAQAMDMFNDIKGKLKDAWDAIKGLFNKFKKTEIGKKVGKNKKSSIWDKLKGMMSKVGGFIKKGIAAMKKALGNLGNHLKDMWDKIKNFDYKGFFKSLSIEDIINFICNTLLKNLLKALDDIIDILRYLQKRFQGFLNRLFAENYRSPFRDLNYLTTMSNFFKSHINICQILRELWADPGSYTLAKFLKRTTNLETIFRQWRHNKNVLKNMGKKFNILGKGGVMGPGMISDVAGAGNALTNSILTMDELFGMNEKTIETIISNLKRAFTLNFKATTGSILDKNAMSKQLFDTDRFKSMSKKLVPW